MLKGCRILLLTIVALCVVAASSQGVSEGERESLKGLDSIRVYVATQMKGEVSSNTDLALQIGTDTELKLRTLGISVVSDISVAQLDVFVHITEQHYIDGNLSGTSSLHIKLGLYQWVRLYRNDYFTRAVTWASAHLASCPSIGAEDFARDLAKDKVDEFLNDYLAVNPKTSGADKK